MLKPIENPWDFGIHQHFLEGNRAERVYRRAQHFVRIMAAKGRHKILCFYTRCNRSTRMYEAGIYYLHERKGCDKIQILRTFSRDRTCAEVTLELFEELVREMGFHPYNPDPYD